MAADYAFGEEEMAVDEGLGYPKAYAKLCPDREFGPYSHGPPFTFTPYALHKQEVMRARDLDQMFPIIDSKARPTAKPKIFLNLLWKQLNHLGNAGFDPAVIRVDPYGNVLYFHADSSSPLSWDIDHWFPCSRGGLTVPSNLKILQWQVCKRKHNKLEFLVPWWDLQLGISVNQFLSIFASSNPNFRHRAFAFLFSEGENEELNDSQTVESHTFPYHFIESKDQLGLAPAAIVVSRREAYDASSPLKSLDYNRLQLRPQSPAIVARKVKPSVSKENENPDFVTNPYQAIVMARDSLKHREERAKIQAEIQKLDDEVHEIKEKNEEEMKTIQDLELTLIKRRRRAEKCRRLAESQSSYRTMLEKMIRDAMHQSVIYKEQVRLNQAASNALMARLEAQKAICDASEKELYRKYKQRDVIEKQIRPEWEKARKRSRMDDTSLVEGDSKPVLYLPGIKTAMPVQHKELRVFLEEEQKLSEVGLSSNEEQEEGEIEDLKKSTKCENSIVALDNENPIEHNNQIEETREGKEQKIRFPVVREPEIEEDEECRKQRGKGNVEKWLQMLLENSQEELDPANENENENTENRTVEIIRKLNVKYPQKEIKILKFPESVDKEEPTQDHEKNKEQEIVAIEDSKKTVTEKGNASEAVNNDGGIGSCQSFDRKERREKNGKEKKLVRSESARAFRRIPSSPSLILGMKKGVDCIRKKPLVTSDEDEDHAVGNNSFIKSSIRTIKKVVKK